MLLNQIPTPALIVDLDVLEENHKQMMLLVNNSSAQLRPHYKSHKCIEIAHLQLRAGAKGITCAKLGEARDLVEAGIDDVLIANQITDKAKIAEVAALAKCCRLGIAVDSLKNIQDLENAAVVQDSTIHCLVEYDIGMKRCGVYSLDDLYTLAKAIDDCKHLVFEGIQAYAGQLSHEPNCEVRRTEGDNIEQKLKEAKAFLELRGLVVSHISGCSTASVQNHARSDTAYTEFQAGSYIFMDVAYGELSDLTFKNSLFVLTTVISQAGGGTIMDAGRKSISLDQKPPVLVGYENCSLKLSEEHTTVHISGNKIEIGEKMKIIPGHCCTCVNLYDYIYFIRGDKVVNKVPITSRGKSL